MNGEIRREKYFMIRKKIFRELEEK